MSPAGFALAKISRQGAALAALALVVGLTAACESASEREARKEREAYINSLDMDELKNSLHTVNPDPYSDGTIKPRYGRRARQ